MNINVTVPEGATEIDPLAERYRAAFTKMEGGRAQWIEGVLELAVVVAEARIDRPDHRSFSRWVQKYCLEPFSHSDLAALHGFSRDIPTARKMLEESKSKSFRVIWEKKPKKPRNHTPPEIGKGPISHTSGSSKRKRAAVIPTVMRDDYVPGEVAARSPEPPPLRRRRQPRAPSVMQDTPPPRKAVRLRELTKEQVDPDFKGTHLEFITKYGHVNLHTKAELEYHKNQEALMAWLGLLSDHEKTARALAAATVDVMTLQEWMAKPAKAEKLRGWCNTIEQSCKIIAEIVATARPVSGRSVA